MTETLISLQEAAERLGVHYMTAYRYVRTGRLAAKKVGAEWRVAPGDLDALRQDDTPSRSRKGTTDYVQRLTDRLVAGDEPGAWSVVEQALTSGTEPAEVYLQLFAPALERIGDGWEAGILTIADEHEASAIVLRLIGRLGPRMRKRGRTRGSIILTSPPGDQHSVPIAILGDLVRANGFRVHDLGADVPADSLVQTALAADRLVAIGIGATTRGNEKNIKRAIAALHAAVDAPVVLGGGAITDVAHAARLGADAYAPRAPEALAVFDAVSTGAELPPEARTA